MLAGAGQAGGEVEWGDLQPHSQCSCTSVQGIRAGLGAPQPFLAQRKGKALRPAGTGVSAKILLFRASEWRSAKEQ